MRPVPKVSTATALVAGILLAAAGPGHAGCKKMGYLVNDYGIEGPTKDAQELLDKHIAAWADEQGITEYSVGKKTVDCELFLNLILFDEHTCTASATVCWGGSNQPKESAAQTAATKSKEEPSAKQAKADDQAKAGDKESKPDPVTAEATPAKDKADAPQAVNDKPKGEPAAASHEAAQKNDGAEVETSALPRYVDEPAKPDSPSGDKNADAAEDKVGDDKGVPTPTTAAAAAALARETPSKDDASVAAERAAADRAAAAAERAAAAAERAAAAAQQAAEAAKQAAAAQSSGDDPDPPAAVVAPVKPSEPK